MIFPVSLRAGLDLRNRYADKGGFSAVVIELRLPDGRIYGQNGKLDYASPTRSPKTPTRSPCAARSQPAVSGRRRRTGPARASCSTASS